MNAQQQQAFTDWLDSKDYASPESIVMGAFNAGWYGALAHQPAVSTQVEKAWRDWYVNASDCDSGGSATFEAGWNAALASQPVVSPWHEAVIDACMTTESCYDSTAPEKTLRALIDWHVSNATAPVVSVEAGELPPLPVVPEPVDIDGARWAYTYEMMNEYGIDCLNVALATRPAPQVAQAVPAEPVDFESEEFKTAFLRQYGSNVKWKESGKPRHESVFKAGNGRLLSDLLQNSVNDPMHANFAEVHKELLRATIVALKAAQTAPRIVTFGIPISAPSMSDEEIALMLDELGNCQRFSYGEDSEDLLMVEVVRNAMVSALGPQANSVDWMSFGLALELALNRGEDPKLLFDENSPIRDELRNLIAAARNFAPPAPPAPTPSPEPPPPAPPELKQLAGLAKFLRDHGSRGARGTSHSQHHKWADAIDHITGEAAS